MLTDVKARKSLPDDKPSSVGGVPGLYFKPGARTGSGKFVLRYVSPETKKRRDMGLGSYPTLSVSQARRLGFEARDQIEAGIDPLAEKQRQKEAELRILQKPTFEQAGRQVFEDIAPAFKSAKHRAQWITTLKTYVFPKLGEKKVDQLKPADFATVLKPIWLSKPETASRIRQRCERVMTWCVAHGFVEYNVVSAAPALLPKQPSKRDRVQHFPSVPWRDLPEMIPLLLHRAPVSVGKQALHFLILTAARSGEVRAATWDEIDLENAIWTIPAQRMKAGAQHRVPLSAQAIALLRQRRAVTNLDGYVFTGATGTLMSDMTMTKVLRDNKVPSDVPNRVATAHGFRSSFRDWASEHNYPRDLAERALAHTIANSTEAAYHRTDLLDQRRDMMRAWADHVAGLIA